MSFLFEWTDTRSRGPLLLYIERLEPPCARVGDPYSLLEIDAGFYALPISNPEFFIWESKMKGDPTTDVKAGDD